MFTITFKNASGTTLGRGQGAIPATALVEALVTLSGWNPIVNRKVMDEWGIHMLGQAADIGGKFVAEGAHDVYDIEMLENGVTMFITCEAAAAAA